MKTTSVLISMFMLISIGSTQTPWSIPQLLCDSTGENRHPTFARTQIDMGYNTLLWERDLGDRSRIFLRSFAVPDSEIAVSPDLPGVHARQPAAALLSYTYPQPPVLIVWQADSAGNFDLYSVEYFLGQLSHYQRLTTHPTDDVNPRLSPAGLVWDREGEILYCFYSDQTHTWSPAEVVDSAACARPDISNWDALVTYEKDSTIQLRRRTGGNWSSAQILLTGGENIRPRVATGFEETVLWQHWEGADWNLIFYSDWTQGTSRFVFSGADETHPVGLDVPMITDDSFTPMYLAFESDSPGDREIYTHNWPFEAWNSYNLSQHAGTDSLPVFSMPAWMEAQIQDVRFWLAWQSRYNGKWQIWGSYSELDVGDIGDEKPPGLSHSFRLHQNYPNPFNNETMIGYRLPKSGEVELAVFSLLGRKVRILFSGKQTAGEHRARWDGNDGAGREVASGVYLYRLKTAQFDKTRKMLFIG